MTNADKAVACFNEGFSCSQAVFSTFAGQFGLDRAIAQRIAAGFGGGMGRMGETCGAVTGAFMVIGLAYGATDVNNQQAKEQTYERVREFTEKFRVGNGSICCRELLGFDISKPEERALAREKNLFTSLCPQLVADAVEIIEEILAPERNNQVVRGW